MWLLRTVIDTAELPVGWQAGWLAGAATFLSGADRGGGRPRCERLGY